MPRPLRLPPVEPPRGYRASDGQGAARFCVSPAERGGWGVDALWSDDFHHTIRVAMTGQREAHFGGYRGTADEWVETDEVVRCARVLARFAHRFLAS